MSKKDEDIEVGKRIRDIRLSYQMNQKEFAKKIGTTVSALSNWENGRNQPKMDSAASIAKLGAISVEELYYGEFRDYVRSVLTKELLKKEDFWERIIKYLQNKELINYGTDESIEEEKVNKAITFIDEHLSEIIYRVQRHNIGVDLYGKEKTIINLTNGFISEKIHEKEISLESYYVNLIKCLAMYIPSTLKNYTMKELIETYRNKGLSLEEAKYKSLETLYKSKIGNIQLSAIEEINDLWDDFLSLKELLDNNSQ